MPLPYSVIGAINPNLWALVNKTDKNGRKKLAFFTIASLLRLCYNVGIRSEWAYSTK